jgi:hypothetical protein
MKQSEWDRQAAEVIHKIAFTPKKKKAGEKHGYR